MDTNSLIIGAVLIAICLFPLILISRKGRQRVKQMKASLTDVAVKNNCKLNKIDTTSSIAIGLDQNKKIVCFYQKNGEKEIHQQLDLAVVSGCKVRKSNYVVDAGSSLEKLELVFNPKNKNDKPISFEFFNSDNNDQLNDELILINQWENEINQLIRS